MRLFSLVIRELTHRWLSSILFGLLVTSVTAALVFLAANRKGLQKEISRNARDIGSNVVILPSAVDQLTYHINGISTETMPEVVVQQLLEYRASLNHLIPTLEVMDTIQHKKMQCSARVVGLSASIPMPGRPKAPMQRAIPAGKVQLGSAVALRLGLSRDANDPITIRGKTFPVERVNKANGTWQDAAVIMDLQDAQKLFDLPGQISRIEAIECTSEKCELTGLKSDVVLANELATITDQALILRRENMARARENVRTVSNENSQLIQNALWLTLILAVVTMSAVNTLQRKSEIGIWLALGYRSYRIILLFLTRSMILSLFSGALGVMAGVFLSRIQIDQVFAITAAKQVVDWQTSFAIGFAVMLICILSSAIPVLFLARRHPAEIVSGDA